MSLDHPVTDHRPVSGAPRALRAALAGGVVTLCAATAHVVARGELTAPVVLGVLAGSTLVAHLLAGHRLETSQLLGLLLLGQAAMHVTAATAADAPGDAAMLTAHLAATAASLLVLRHGEDAWWRVAEHLGLRAAAKVVVAPSVPPPAAPVDSWTHLGPSLLHLAHVMQGRAPPVGP